MSPDFYKRVEQIITDGELWRAKEILQSAIGERKYDTKLFRTYGKVLLNTQDKYLAGLYLFLSGSENQKDNESIQIFINRNKKNILNAIPGWIRHIKQEDFPEPVQKILAKYKYEPVQPIMSLEGKRIFPEPEPYTYSLLGNVSILLTFLFVLFLLVLGLWKLIEWIF